MVSQADHWMCQGLCAKSEFKWAYENFFGTTASQRRIARDICYSCPVRDQCLRWALEKPEIWGVWGGLDEGELRRALSVDAVGEPLTRCRFPHCPRCRSRPNKLVVVALCELSSGRRREYVLCGECDFTWAAVTSVAAVRSYWRMVKRRERKLKQARIVARRIAAHDRRSA